MSGVQLDDLGARLQELVAAKGWNYEIKPGALNGYWLQINMPDDPTTPIKRQSFRSEGSPEGAARNAIEWMEKQIAAG